MTVRKIVRSGFTLIEIVVTLTLLTIMAGVALVSMRPAATKAPSRGLASALQEEFAAARQLAISGGRPVALGLSASPAAPVATSVYRLEGWNKPTVTWSKSFSGDYPEAGFAAARWSGGGTWTDGAEESAVSKIGAFQLSQWLPADLRDDYVFCFTPEGGLVTNAMPALDNRYVVVVGRHLGGSASAHGLALTSVNDPITLLVSPYGGVEAVTGTPGATFSGGGAPAAVSAPVERTTYEPGQVRLSNIRITPRLEGGDPEEGVCAPGQFVTLEVYAYDPEGRGLFAKWKQPGNRGVFTYPDGGAASGAVLESEVDRMEFVKEAPSDITWEGTSPPPGGLFRARWSWTVPIDSPEGTQYDIEVDVKDAKGECSIVNPPAPVKMIVAPRGRIIAEKFIDGIWQLVQLNPDGSNQQLLSPPGVSETMASLDAQGGKMALLQGTGTNKYIKVRSLDGGFERTIAGPGNFVSVSLSPNGTWVSYPNLAGAVVVQKVDGSGGFTLPQSLSAPNPPPRARSGWSGDSEYLFYESRYDIHAYHMASGTDTVLVGRIRSSSATEPLYCPTWYRVGGQERVLFSLGNYNPVLMSVAFQRTGGGGVQQQAYDTDYPGFSAWPGSHWVDFLPDDPSSIGSEVDDDSFPNIRADGSFLVLNRTALGSPVTDAAPNPADNLTVSLLRSTPDGNFIGPPVYQMENRDLRRAIWLP